MNNFRMPNMGDDLSSHLIAVAPLKELSGVNPPGTMRGKGADRKSYTYDWRAERRSEQNTAGIRADMEIGGYTRMMTRSYNTDSFFVGYLLIDTRTGLPPTDKHGNFRQPRVNKDSIEWLRSEGYEVYTQTFLADVDTPGHVAWTPALRAAAEERLSICSLTKTCTIYFTRNGYRLVQPLAKPILSEKVESLLHEWLTHLDLAGIRIDPKCRDWTRFMRCPRVLRDGKRSDSDPIL